MDFLGFDWWCYFNFSNSTEFLGLVVSGDVKVTDEGSVYLVLRR